MKLRIPKRQPGMPAVEAFLVQVCAALDRSVTGLRTVFLVAGLAAAALRMGRAADFLFVTGLLLQLSIWFENWWLARRSD
jgi:hypothetical protein